MQQKYMIGSALLLLGVAATGFLIDENAKESKHGIAAQNEAPQIGALQTPAGNGRSNESTDQFSELKNNTEVGNQYQLATSNTRPAEQTQIVYEDPAPAANDNTVVALSTPVKKQANAPKIYYARSIDNSTVKNEKKRHHFNFRLPENTGIEIGFNQSGLFNNQTNNMAVGNFNFGLLYNFNMGDHMAFQPAIRYVTSGNRLQNEMEIDNKEKLTMHNLEVPANLVWKPGKIGNVRIMIGAGPYVSYQVGAKDKYQATPYTDDGNYVPSAQQYNTANINKLNWGMGGFIGIQSPDGFYMKAGGEYSMMDLMKNNSSRTYSLMVNVGFIMGNKL